MFTRSVGATRGPKKLHHWITYIYIIYIEEAPAERLGGLIPTRPIIGMVTSHLATLGWY